MLVLCATPEEPMQSLVSPQLDQLVDTLRAVTEDDVTEPLLPTMRTLIGKLGRCSEAPRATVSARLGGRHPESPMWNAL
jgi:hypothetical protein